MIFYYKAYPLNKLKHIDRIFNLYDMFKQKDQRIV